MTNQVSFTKKIKDIISRAAYACVSKNVRIIIYVLMVKQFHNTRMEAQGGEEV
jgi:hypothetical protein